MSETSSLTELARFVGQSSLGLEDALLRQRVVNATGASIAPKRQRHSVGELLGVVLVLSARTRRVAMPKVAIDLDVFGPEGGRAVRVIMRQD